MASVVGQLINRRLVIDRSVHGVMKTHACLYWPQRRQQPEHGHKIALVITLIQLTGAGHLIFEAYIA